MTKRLAIFFIILLFSCKNEKQFTLPDSKEIDAIIETIVFDDTLGIAKNNNSTKILKNLSSLKIINWDNKKNKLPPKVDLNSILLQDLIGYEEIPTGFFFQKSDTTYIIYQNKTLNNHIVKSEKLNKLNVIEMPNKNEHFTKQSIYSFTIPIFSSDNNRAYTQMTLSCPGLCGSGYKIYLIKKNGNWFISERKLIWIS